MNIIEKNLTNLEHVQVYDILKELEKKQPPLRSRLNYESQNCGNDNKIKKNSKEKNQMQSLKAGSVVDSTAFQSDLISAKIEKQ